MKKWTAGTQTAREVVRETDSGIDAQTGVTLTNCDREPIRIPGQIQPHGLLLVLSSEHLETLEILQVSANVERFCGVAPGDLIGQPLSRLLGAQPSQKVKAALSSLQPDLRTLEQSEPVSIPALRLLPEVSAVEQLSALDWRGLLHVDGHVDGHIIVLELTPEDCFQASQSTTSEALYASLRQSIHCFQSAKSLSALTAQIVQTVAALTGFDRVMVYQFDTDYSGIVTAEALGPTLEKESFSGLRYPATDIPVQARELYLKNWLRIIPDVNYTPVPLVPERHPQTQRPLDLGATDLRSVSPMHVEYLQNMGVSASMSISLIVEGRLWGLIACHHYAPKQISFEVRKLCEMLGQVASLALFRQQTLVEKHYLDNVRSIQQKIRHRLVRSQPTHAISTVLTHHQQELLALVRASGAAIALDSQLTLIGETPASERIEPLLNWLRARREEVYYTHSLPQAFPDFESEQDCACGLLAISIFLPQSSYHVLWFRPELVQLVDWAGNPSKQATVGKDGSLYLTPRQSFERWKETVRGQSLSWESSEIAAAEELRSTLLLAALKFSQAALKRTAYKAQVANQAKSQFLAKMSHELRTPLNAILGFSQLIHYHETLSPEQRDRLDIINRSGEHLLSLINDVLETSRIEAGQLRLNETCFDLHQLIASVQDMLTLRAVNKGLLLKIEQGERVPQYVWGDQSKLRQIIINLVGNAIKFTERGQVTLGVSCEPEAAAADDLIQVQFQISDTGSGISAENLEAIFEPFQQEVGRQAHEGTGLGLSISRQNARLMQGDIEVRSQPDEGSVFICRVQLGLRTADDLAPETQQRRVVALAPGQPNYRILVAEDVAENRQLLISLLTTVGFEVRAANDGQAAVDLWRQWRPDCIWMDLYMPGVDGYEATRRIRAEQARAEGDSSPVIIALSASAIDHLRSDAIASGFDDYVSKPFQVNQIFEKMAQYIGVRYQYADGMADEEGGGQLLAGQVVSERAIALPASEAEIAAVQTQLLAQPTDWQAAFYRAVLGAREQQIAQLIQQLSSATLAERLNICLWQLRFDLLGQIVEPLGKVV